MTIARYANYHDSGIDWAGEVPSHWSTLVLRRAVRLRTEKATDRRWPIGLENIQSGTGRFIETGSEFEGEGVAFSAFDVLYGKLRPYLAKVLVAPQPGEAIGDFHVLSPDRRRLDPNFLAYLLLCPSVISLLNGSTYGAKMPRVGWEFMGRVGVALPPLDEQAAIAAFLDHETGKIDALVETQRRLIDLLKEKRQVAISHAVTKGLDPAVPMKNSGVDWLGEVPAHWSVRRLKAVAHIQTGVAKGKDNGSSETVQVPYLRVANVQDGWIDLSDVATIELPTSDVGRYRLQAGDVLMNEGGDFDKLGRGGIWHGQIDPCVHQNHVFSVRPFSVSPEWLSLTTGSVGAQFFFKGRSKQSTNLASISSTNLMELPILVPPRKEQQEIVDHLTGLIDGSDDLIDEAGKAIALLQERRSALISAAVTGKIDVRQQAEVPSAIDHPTARRLVGAAVLELVADNATSGRMTSAKRMYLAEAHAGVWELRGQPERRAAGPFDNALMNEVETELARVGHIATSQPGGSGCQVHYSLTGTRGALRAELDAMLGDRRALFDKMLADLGTLESKGVEAVATLYAVWNDMLIDGQTPVDAAVINGVLNDWHEEKRDKFTRPDLVNYLGWMRRHDLTPSGRGPRTKSGALL
ncbi:restriction endonuclease subunit S [Brevundimonas nasdae]|uniref:restriction endonuclease subunit S n=1 Tax=Brevundimonas nasdae TaxID=172043 RepID=UPI00289C586D|nr:restriction endonuclease subunit S [Brevundimonas nasdae]